MTDLKRELADGLEAQQLLDNRVYQSAVAKVRDGVVASMAQSAIGDKETHHQLVIVLQLLDQLERNIRNVANTGKLAALQLEKESAVSKVKRFIQR